MLTRRIIPCLDVHDGQVVKGIQFRNLVEEGDPVERGAHYSREGADELVFLDISASIEARRHVVELARRVAREVFIPFTIGGGLRTVEDIGALLSAGADKVALNTAALERPALITEGAERFGSQCMVLAMDVTRRESRWEVFSHGGTKATGREALSWALEAMDRGAGELLLTSIDADGTQTGVDVALTCTVSRAVSIPVIASGGIGRLEHFKEAVVDGEADAVLAASVFHRDILSIRQVKDYLERAGIPVRPVEEEG
ncbi:MAG: imidazole glycerol phosphate synthase subunit HisF [Fidelibacterota bacterium]|nr:MAG: imidazole glycerol phosphate synthase subunit HisF [Candidatus Neomarinimicrobiota bacterium]